jgi:hypothetical protein
VEEKNARQLADESLEKLRRFTYSREERVVELKREINSLLHEMGRPAKYGD